MPSTRPMISGRLLEAGAGVYKSLGIRDRHVDTVQALPRDAASYLDPQRIVFFHQRFLNDLCKV